MEQDSIYSKETLDILGKMPNAFIRYGLSVFFFILLGILTGLCFIHYPDTFNIPVTIYKEEYPNDTIMKTEDKYIVRMQVNANDIWKIKYGSTVNISLNQYPKNIYGLLSGNIIQITQKDTLHVYDVDIQLSNGLTTNFNKTLEYLPDMAGVAIMKGKNKSIFKRIFSSMLSEN
jgi:hypothetical protein